MSTDPKELAQAFEAMAAEAMAQRPAGTLKSRGGKTLTLKTDTGKIVTHGQLISGLLLKETLKGATIDEKRPEFISCENCNAPVKVAKLGGTPKRCAKCRGIVCVDCGGKRSHGPPGRCRPCASKAGVWVKIGAAVNANRTQEQRREMAKAGALAMSKLTPDRRAEIRLKMGASIALTKSKLTPEQRSDALKKANAARTPEDRSRSAKVAAAKRLSRMSPEQRSDAARAGALRRVASMSPEQRSDALKKANAALTPDARRKNGAKSKEAIARMTPEQRYENARRANAAMTPEQRSEARRKAWATRRANASSSSAPPPPETT